MGIHLEILDEERRALLPLLGVLRGQGFYLAGGTALALQLGHRDSIDFDFFRTDAIDDTSAFFNIVAEALMPHMCIKTQEERNTLGILVDGSVRVSVMSFPYPLVGDLVQTAHLDLASIADIGCMKLNAITGRGAWKDYVDLYFITNTMELSTLLEHLRQKMPSLDPMLILKSLVYFEDLHEEPILYKVTPVPMKTVQETLIKRVQALG